MKICLVSRGYPPEIFFGGIETYIYNLAHGLSKLGHQVVILAETKKETRFYMDGEVKIYRISTKDQSFLGKIFKTMTYRWRLSQELRKIIFKEEIEIIEVPDNSALSFFYSIRPIKNIPLVVRLHTPLFLFRKLNNYPPNNFKTKAIEWMEKVVIKKADGLSSPSKMLAKIVADSLNFKKDKIKIIPNLVDTSFFSPSNRKAASPIVLFVGRLERIKGADILIEAINKIDGNVPDAEFMLIGDSTPDFRIKLTARIKEYHLQNKVNLLGKIDYLKLPAYYQKASLFVIPSRWDNFPGSCLEAEASGLPIIASSVGGLKEQLVKDGKNGFLVAPENASELAQKMSLLLKNPELRQQMGQESLKIVKNYQPSCVAEKMVEYYRQIIIKKKEQK